MQSVMAWPGDENSIAPTFPATSPPYLHGQARPRRLLFPVRPHVDLVSTAAALGADHPAAEVRQFSFGWVAPDFYQRSMTAGIVEARRDKSPHTQLAQLPSVIGGRTGCLGSPIVFVRVTRCCSVVLVSLRSVACHFLRSSLFHFPLRLRLGGLCLLGHHNPPLLGLIRQLRTVARARQSAKPPRRRALR
jgi:hypothetical protein